VGRAPGGPEKKGGPAESVGSSIPGDDRIRHAELPSFPPGPLDLIAERLRRLRRIGIEGDVQHDVDGLAEV